MNCYGRLPRPPRQPGLPKPYQRVSSWPKCLFAKQDRRHHQEWGRDDYCTRAYGLGSQCRPNECIFGSGKPRGVGILVGRVYEPGEGMGKLVYEQPGNEDPVTARRVPSK